MAQMICGVLSDEVDDGDARPAGVVQIRKAVRETGAEMQKRACRFFSHARIAVSRSRDDTFEQTEHAPYCRHSLKRSDKMNFRSAGVGKAHFNPTRHQGANETFCTIHCLDNCILSALPESIIVGNLQALTFTNRPRANPQVETELSFLPSYENGEGFDALSCKCKRGRPMNREAALEHTFP
jgi:hypothetical protein